MQLFLFFVNIGGSRLLDSLCGFYTLSKAVLLYIHGFCCGEWILTMDACLSLHAPPPSGQVRNCIFNNNFLKNFKRWRWLTEPGVPTCKSFCGRAPLKGKHTLIHKLMLEKVQSDFILIYNLNGGCVLLEMLIIITKQSVCNIFP